MDTKVTANRCNFPESQVVRLCQEKLPGRTDLFTEDGGPVRIIYPGRLNDDRGADLRDAVITTENGPLTGDIEVHVRSSGWWAHGHHEDPVYNRVVLHVVFWHDVAQPVFLQNGRRIPTLSLNRFVTAPIRLSRKGKAVAGGWPAPCRRAGRPLSVDRRGEVMDQAGDQRFVAAAAGFGATLSESEASQALYCGILRALGYARNKHPMVELAARMPLKRLEAALPTTLPDDEWLAGCQALLMGTAGLLPSQRPGQGRESRTSGGWVAKLEDKWKSCGETAIMSMGKWQSFKVRPGNLPMRRLAAMSYLMRRYRREGLLAGLMRLFDDCPHESPHGLESALVVSAEGPWVAEIDFGLPARWDAPALLGRDRAADIIINVLLPFAFSRGNTESRPDLTAKARNAYCAYPRLAENTLERHMRVQTGINRYLINSARRQQGLLHIFKTLCSRGRCGECELGLL